MNNHMIETLAVCKSYKDNSASLNVLKEINLKVGSDEFLVIQGPSGAGKSTLLHILGGLDQPSRGQVIFCGTDLYNLSDNQRAAIRNKKIGFVFQFFHLLPELNALENVLLPAFFNSWWQGKKTKAYAQQLLEKLGLSGRLTHKPKQLSGGEQQRVAIARALINRPQILFCDEPTGNLDSDNGRNILELIKNLKKESNFAVVLVTHDNDIAGYADRVVRLKDGIIQN
ncbi:MAG: ABC transporter ATP-binding protein [Candidatus Omnitrophica bacterium]|jgi:ABC-type lipoprotein export system ATPase subunit|nr:ABC transporter ATP-binding protein [Candidatus Omnitrophota bacterium]